MIHCILSETLSKNASAFMPRSIVSPLLVFALGCGLVGWLVGVGTLDAQAQSRQGQQAPAQQRAAPGQGRAPVGSQGPAATRPSNPSSSLGPSPGGANTPSGTQTPGQAQTNAPGTPSDPSQVPLGGAEWLAAAGAAYALNRLRDDESDEEDEDA